MRNNRGFTLIELMVTIAVLAIIASIAAPSFSDHIAKQSLDNSGMEVLSALNEGRSKAIALRAVVVVCPSKDSAGAKITPEQCVTKTISGADGDKFVEQNRVLLANIIDSTGVTSTVSGVVFLPTGNVRNAQTFTLCAKNKSKNIVVAATGASDILVGTC
ncbi:GspH/FimT family pseudopilin [Acinetobacter sp. P8-3-8]|uniref:GspH/FimT family pseudopilin n=1 Tax=Acinetobacter sp. P8-3-8 TaxID=1029823 RepID=UPI0002F8C7AC|nr:GspH/FimT family pseudopilin [Acinetobacter sp. P8-3-8]